MGRNLQECYHQLLPPYINLTIFCPSEKCHYNVNLQLKREIAKEKSASSVCTTVYFCNKAQVIVKRIIKIGQRNNDSSTRTMRECFFLKMNYISVKVFSLIQSNKTNLIVLTLKH